MNRAPKPGSSKTPSKGGLFERANSEGMAGEIAFDGISARASAAEMKEILDYAVQHEMGNICSRILWNYSHILNEQETVATMRTVIRDRSVETLGRVIDMMNTDERVVALQDDLIQGKRLHQTAAVIYLEGISSAVRKNLAEKLVATPEGAAVFLESDAAQLGLVDLSAVFETAASQSEGGELDAERLLRIAYKYNKPTATPVGSVSFKKETVLRCAERILRSDNWEKIDLLMAKPAAETFAAHNITDTDLLELYLREGKIVRALIGGNAFGERFGAWKDITPELTLKAAHQAMDSGILPADALFEALVSKNIDIQELLRYCAGSKSAHSLLSPRARESTLDEHITPDIVEMALKTMCRRAPSEERAKSIEEMSSTSFAYPIKVLGSDRFRDLLVSEGKTQALIILAASYGGPDAPLDLRKPEFEVALQNLKGLKLLPWGAIDATAIKERALAKHPHVLMPESFYEERYQVKSEHAQTAFDNRMTLSGEMVSLLLKAHAGLGKPASPCLARITKEFGFDCTEIYFKYLTGRKLPVFEADAKHVEELNRRIETVRRERLLVLAQLLKGNVTAQYLEEEPLRLAFLLDVIRFDKSEWGKHGKDEFLDLVRRLEEYQKGEKGPLDPLPEEYKGGFLKVSLQSKETQPVQFPSAEFTNKYRILVEDLHAVHKAMDPKGKVIGDPFGIGVQEAYDAHPHPVTQMRIIVKGAATLLEEVRADIQAVQKTQEEKGNDKALPRLEKALRDMESIDLKRPGTWKGRIGDLIALAAEFSKGDQERRARQLLMMLAIQQGRILWRPNIFSEDHGHHTDPVVENIADLENALNHITYKETWLPLVKDEKSYVKALRKLLPTKFLQEELAKYESVASKDSMEINAHPARGLALECSGHIGDACWASKYDLINEKCPNFLSLTFTRKTKLGDEPIGATLLIETVTQAGEKAIIIRGLNPLQRVMGGKKGDDAGDVGSLMPKSFIDELKRYLIPIAQARGAHLGIVIDNHSGGSGTNRPLLHSYLWSKLKPTLSAMVPLSNDDTEFNGYDIRRDTYYLWENKNAVNTGEGI